jgi:ATP-dependent protease ClpP protease subunit
MHKILLTIALFLHPVNLHATTFKLSGEVDSDLADKTVSFLEENPGPVTLVINGPGGSVFAAQEIENAIEAHGRSYLRS